MSEEQEPLDIELANLQKLNGVIEDVIAALDASTINTENVDSTVKNADKLLDLWIRVLARSDHAQKLILDERWQGATYDMEALEHEQSQASRRVEEQQQAQARRELEEQEARERQEREDSERKSVSSTTTRGRPTVRGKSMTGVRGRGSTIKKEPVSAYAQTTRPKVNQGTSQIQGSVKAESAEGRSGAIGQVSGGVPSAVGRGRGIPVVRGTRASRGRQQGLGRSASAEHAAFK